MTVIKLSRNQDFLMIANVAPFVFVGYLKTWQFEEWGAGLSDDVVIQTNSRTEVIAVYSNFLTQYDEQATYNDMLAQESSYYPDKANQLIYFHVDHSHNPVFSGMGIGYAFGFSKGELVYINDVVYLPLIKSIPSLAREADVLGSKKPIKATGTVILENREIKSLDTGRREGILDFLIDEPIYGNPLFVFEYDGTTLTPLSSWTVKKPIISETDARLELSDRRYA